MDNRAETSLALHDDVRDTHLAAKRGEEDDKLNGVDIVGDNNEVGLLRLDESNTVVETVLDEEGLLGVLSLGLLLLSGGLGDSLKTSLLLLLGLRAVPSLIHQYQTRRADYDATYLLRSLNS